MKFLPRIDSETCQCLSKVCNSSSFCCDKNIKEAKLFPLKYSHANNLFINNPLTLLWKHVACSAFRSDQSASNIFASGFPFSAFASRDPSRCPDNWSDNWSMQISMRTWMRAFLTCSFCSPCNSRPGCDTSASQNCPRAARTSDAFCPAPLCTRPSCRPFSCKCTRVHNGKLQDRLKYWKKEIRNEIYFRRRASGNALKLEIKALERLKIRKPGRFSQRLLDRAETGTTRWKQLIHISRFN